MIVHTNSSISSFIENDLKNHCPDNVIDHNSVSIHNDLSLDQFEVNGNHILTQNDTSGSASTNSTFDSESSQDSSSGDMDGSFSDLSSNDISGDNGFDFTITKGGHSKKLIKPRSLKSVRLNSFCVRTIDRCRDHASPKFSGDVTSSCRRDFERCFIKQGDTRLHVAAVLTPK